MQQQQQIFTSKAALVTKMRAQITRDEKQAARALIRIYNYQVEDEKKSRDVKYHNNVGFMPQDAKLLSGIACWVLAGHALTERQFNAVKDRIAKYAGQLVNQAIERGLIVKWGHMYVWGQQLKDVLPHCAKKAV